jgi:nitrous oxidase accessory protein
MRDKKHQSKIINGLLFSIFILIVILLASGTACSESTEVWVDSQYNSSTPGWNFTHFATIQSAINSVANNGTVTVRSGTYYENLLIEKPILLTGESEQTTLIDGQGKDFTLDIRSGDVEIKDLKLTNSGTMENYAVSVTGPGNITVHNNYFLDKGIFIGSNNCKVTNNKIEGQGSIFLSSAWDNTIENNYLEVSSPGQIWLYGRANNNIINNNTIIGIEGAASCTGLRSIMSNNNQYTNNRLKGFRVHILLSCSENNILEGNTLSGNWGTIDSEVGGGIVLYRSGNNWIGSNSISSVFDAGIMLFGGANENQIKANTINDAERGIELYFSSDRNNIINNTITNCFTGFRSFSSNNNKFFSNNVEVSATQAYDDSVNIWNEDGVGNYWDYYQGTDANGDGIGDTPHPIPPNTKDPSPLVSPAEIVSQDVPTLLPLAYDFTFTPDTVIDSDVVWEDQSIDLTNRIIIKNGGSLTLDGTTLNIKGRNNFVFIDVNAGGTLNILDSTLNSQGACIWAKKGSSLHIENSLLYKLGVWGGDGAVQVACDNSIIKNNIIDGGYAGLNVIDGASNTEFVGNTVRNVRFALRFCCDESLNNKIEDNVFENIVDHVIIAQYGFGKSRITGNSFINVWSEVMMIPNPGPGNIITNNTYENCPPYVDRPIQTDDKQAVCYGHRK